MKKLTSILLSIMICFICLRPVEGASIKLNKTKATIKVSKTLTLKVLNTSKKVTWSSSNKKIAKVSTKGKVTAVKPGTTYIKAKVSGKTYRCRVKVIVWLSATSATLKSGKTKTLTLKGTTIKSYKSSNTKVAKLTKTSTTKVKITAHQEGKATITIKGKNNTSYKCSVTVNAYITATKISLALQASKKVTLKGTDIQSVESSNTDVATVSSNGTITAVSEGTATFTYIGTNNKTYTCKVSVKNPQLSHQDIYLPVGQTLQLRVLDTSDTPVYESDDTSIATISNKGKITAVSGGVTTVTATASSITLTATVHISGYLNTNHVTLTTGGTYTLKLIGTSIVSASSANTSVASISKKGKITAKAAGQVTMTIIDSNNDTMTCEVVVVDNNSNTVELTVGTVASAASLLNTSSGTYKTSNQKIALVEKTYGIIVPVSEGTCTISNGDASIKIKVLGNDHVKTGIDVSKWQGSIDVDKLKAYHLGFVILRGGHGDTSDPKFTEFVKKLYEGQMPFGIYWYLESHDSSRDMNEADAKSEAQSLVDMLKEYKTNDNFNDYFQLPIYLDLEDNSLYASEYKGQSKAAIAAHMQSLCEAFIDVLESNGYTNYSIYANKSFTESYLNNAYFASFARKYWHARYGYSGAPSVSINSQTIMPNIWQIGDHFDVAGTGSTNTDVDYWYQ